MYWKDKVEVVRRRIFEVIEVAKKDDPASVVYDTCMMIVILVCMVPLAFKRNSGFFASIDWAATIIFIIDYALRVWTADLKLDMGSASHIAYLFTPMAIIDLLAILPSVAAMSSAFRIAKLFRLFRSFKMFRYSRSISIIANVIRCQKSPLTAVATMAIAYILISALVIFNVEPDTFHTFFDAVYWATVSLTTMGYGDIYPVTTIGRMVTMVSSFVGIAIVALPASIITAGYMDNLHTGDKTEQPPSANDKDEPTDKNR